MSLRCTALLNFARIVRRDDVALRVEQIAFAIAFEDFAKQPAVSVRSRQTACCASSALNSGVPVSFRKSKSDHKPRRLAPSGLRFEFLLLFILTRIVLRRRIHLRAVALVVPPRQAEITRDHVRAGVHVTDHALRRRNLARELVPDRMARFVLRNRRVGRLRASEISGLVIES